MPSQCRRRYQSHTLFLHYARGIALGVGGQQEAAEAEQVSFRALLAKVTPTDRLHHNANLLQATSRPMLRCDTARRVQRLLPGLQMGEVAADVLAGELLYRKGEFDGAFAALEGAVA